MAVGVSRKEKSSLNAARNFNPILTVARAQSVPCASRRREAKKEMHCISCLEAIFPHLVANGWVTFSFSLTIQPFQFGEEKKIVSCKNQIFQLHMQLRPTEDDDDDDDGNGHILVLAEESFILMTFHFSPGLVCGKDRCSRRSMNVFSFFSSSFIFL